MTRHFLRKGGFLAILLAAIALGLGAWGLREGATARALAEQGRDATATVLDRRIEVVERVVDGDVETDTRYLVTYGFDAVLADGAVAPQRTEEAVPEATYEAAEPGLEVAVRYLPEDPSSADFSEGATALRARLIGWFAAAAAAGAAVLAALGWRGARRMGRLERSGLRTTGTVEKVHRGEGTHVFVLRYLDAAGVERHARAHAVTGEAWEEVGPGAVLPLLCDPDDPRNIAILEGDRGPAGVAEPA